MCGRCSLSTGVSCNRVSEPRHTAHATRLATNRPAVRLGLRSPGPRANPDGDIRMTDSRNTPCDLGAARQRDRRKRCAVAALGLLFQCVVPALRAQQPVRHTVTADDGHPLTVWEKRPTAPRVSILLLHGRTWPALPDFDLQVASDPASLMDALVARGFAVYALDARGYGATPRDSSGWLTPDQAAADAITVCRWVAKNSGVAGAPVLFGWSQGSIVGQLAAQRAPDAMSALVLFGHFTFPAPLPGRHDARATPARGDDCHRRRRRLHHPCGDRPRRPRCLRPSGACRPAGATGLAPNERIQCAGSSRGPRADARAHGGA